MAATLQNPIKNTEAKAVGFFTRFGEINSKWDEHYLAQLSMADSVSLSNFRSTSRESFRAYCYEVASVDGIDFEHLAGVATNYRKNVMRHLSPQQRQILWACYASSDMTSGQVGLKVRASNSVASIQLNRIAALGVLTCGDDAIWRLADPLLEYGLDLLNCEGIAKFDLSVQRIRAHTMNLAAKRHGS